uniref:Conorfamide-Ep1 n=1 Tax=Conus episcopatus TaxID=88764 RepID=CRFA1_CONEP|nr:RecName: Full=Conorfamide-Ep1; Short=CNF-Ep1; AltName: Full=Cono-RFamide-Ep1; Flags: Precursor [Conus episcopatus]
MSGCGFLLLALLLLVTVEATKMEKKNFGILFYFTRPRNNFVRIGRRDMQSPLLSERLRF